jgi:glycerol-3-phosphate dehydrogenase
MPTYGHGIKGKEILRVGLILNDMVTYDRNWGIRDPQRRIPPGRFISREECLELFPGLDRNGLTGAAVFHDGQMYNPTRLTLAFLKSAVRAGADVANYVQVKDLIRDGDRIIGVKARDTLAGNEFEIRGQVIINAAGPWANRLLKDSIKVGFRSEPSFSRDAYFVVGRHLLSEKYALALQAKTKDSDAIISRGHRHLFIIPWRDYTLVGVWHVYYRGEPGEFTVTEEDLGGFIREINEAYPSLELTLKDISMFNAGLILFGEDTEDDFNHSFGKRSLIIDHAKEHYIKGLLTVIGVRYTTARAIAEKAVDLVFDKLGRKAPKSNTESTPVYGGEIENFEEFLAQATKLRPKTLNEDVMPGLIHNYGSAYQDVLKYIKINPSWSETLDKSKIIEAEVINAVREEMAQKLGDVVFRRTDLGTGEHPGETALQRCAHLMASEMGWDDCRVQKELEEVRLAFPNFNV